MRVEFIVPFPPSVNRIWRHAKGRTYRNPRYMQWIERAVEASSGVQGGEPYDGPVSVELRLYGPSRRSYDLDNRAKVLCDLLERIGVIANDDQVARLVMLKGEVVKPAGGCVVLVEALPRWGVCPRWPG